MTVNQNNYIVISLYIFGSFQKLSVNKVIYETRIFSSWYLE